MKKILLLSIRSLIFLISLSVIYILLVYFISFLYKPDLQFFPVQYFFDTDNSSNSIIALDDSFYKEIIFSPNTSQVLRLYTIFLIIAFPIILLIYHIYFIIRNRKQISIKARILVLPIYLFIVFLVLIIVVFLPKYSLYPIFKFAEYDLDSHLVDISADRNVIKDPEEIISRIHTSRDNLDIIVGYGKYSKALESLTKNPYLKKQSNYNLMVLPSMAMYLANNDKGSTTDSESLLYYPDTNRLVVKDLNGLDTFTLRLIMEKIRSLKIVEMDKLIDKKGNPNIYKIVPDNEYSRYTIEALNNINEKTIELNNKNYTENLKVIADCDRIKSENDKLIKEQENEYNYKCPQGVYNINCANFKNVIESNKDISNKNNNFCLKEIPLAKKYNQEIIENNDRIRKTISEVNTAGTLQRNKSELSAAIFINPSSIYIRYDKTGRNIIYNSLHELLHYLTYNNGRDIPEFIDEGITDYLTSKAYGYDEYQSVAISGYYAEKQIIFSLMEKIPIDEIIKAYISGSNTIFKTMFEKYFPGVSYRDFVKMGNDIFNTTYEVNGRRKIYTTDIRDYMYLEDVANIRELLGLYRYIKY